MLTVLLISETSEGLESSMTTRYYSRARAIQLLLPLLNRSASPHVVNVLAGGQEGSLDLNDLDLRRPGNFSLIKSAVHSATMLTLILEHWAGENPRIQFTHSYPGFTASPLFSKGSSGILNFFLSYIAGPVLSTLFAASADDVGAKTLFYATNARYAVDEKPDAATPLPAGLARVQPSKGGVFLINDKGEAADNEKVLEGLRGAAAEKVWESTQKIFSELQ